MKVKKNIITKLLTLFIVFVVYGNYKQQLNAIVGNWALDYENSIASITGTSKILYNQMYTPTVLHFKNSYSSWWQVFNNDLIYKIANNGLIFIIK